VGSLGKVFKEISMEGEGFSGFWSLTVILGPIVLFCVILFAVLRRRRLTAREHVAQDAATERAYREPEKLN
jgi:uncharacterized membrane protein